MKRVLVFASVVALTLVTSGLPLAQGTADPLVGVWKLNPAKSKASPGSSVPKSATIKYETQGEALKVTADIVDQDGTTRHQAYTAMFDGKESPVTGDPDRDSTTMKRIDAYTAEVVGTKAGKPSVTYRRVVSKDGKTLTLRETGTDAKGQKVNDVAVYDKQ
jgi:hypothetical protein